jgi:hypothetical protein
VRPVLYLSSNVKISGGEGTSQKPYQLSISWVTWASLQGKILRRAVENKNYN